MTTALEIFRAARIEEVVLSGTPIRYRSFGQGPAVLLLHGWPLSGITYRQLVAALSPQFRCIVPDLPGAGDTPWSAQIAETTQGYTRLLHAFVDQLGLDRLAIIGHDSGGGVARLLAAELGSRVTSVVLQNTELPNHVPWLVRVLKLSAQSSPPGALSRLLRSRSFRHSSLGFGGCFADRALIEGEFYEACVVPLLSDMRGAFAMLSHLDLGWTRVLPEVHARISAPIHLFWGAQDKFFPLDLARGMSETFATRGEFQVVANGKLYVHEEAPEALARFTLPLLQKAFTQTRAERVGEPAHADSPS
jgi:haloalkane dehalogenase